MQNSRLTRFVIPGVFLVAFLAGSIPVENLSAQNVQDDYRIASSYYDQNDWKDSVNAFEALVADYPGSVEEKTARFYLGEAEMQLGNYRNAYNWFSSFISVMPQDVLAPQALFRMAESSYRLDQNDQAVKLFQTFIFEYPNHALNEFALPHLGELRLEKVEPQLAIRAFETAITKYPNSELANKCRLGIAKARQMSGQSGEAQDLYESLARGATADISGDASLQMGILAFSRQKYSAAKSSLSEAVAKCAGDDHSLAEANYWLARTEMAIGNSQNAINLFTNAINNQMGAELGEAILFDGAVAAIGNGNEELADQWLGRLVNEYPTSRWADKAMQLRVDLAVKNSQFGSALEMITEFKRRFAGSEVEPNVLESEGRVLYQQGEYDASIVAFDKLLTRYAGRSSRGVGSGRATWMYLKSLSHIGKGELDVAESLLEGINLTDESTRLKTLVEVATATACYGQEKFGRCIQGYRNYLALEPDGTDAARARTQLTIALAKLGKWEQASTAFDQLRAKHPGQPVIGETGKFLAEASFADNEHERSAHFYKLLGETGTDVALGARAMSGLAWTQLKTGKTEEAMATFEKLLKEHPDTEYAQEAAMARAKHFDDAKQYGSATKMYTYVIDKYPDTKLAYTALLRKAYALQQTGGRENLQSAIGLLQQYIEIPKANPEAVDQLTLDEAYYQLGWVYKDLGDDVKGLEQFREISNKYRNSKYWPDAAYRLAQHLVSNRKYDAAESLFKRLIRKDTPPEILTRVLYLQGRMAASSNRWDAVSRSMEGLVSSSDDPELVARANYWLAESMYRQNDFEGSSVRFSDLLVKQKQYLSDDLAPWIHLRAAQCEIRLRKWKEAFASATFAKAKYPEFEAVYEYDFVKGRAHAGMGRFTDARESFELVMASKTGSSSETAAMAAWHIGESYFHQEDYAEAIRAYQKVEALFDYPNWRAAALIQAGKCQEHLSNWTNATRLYTRLIENFPESPFRAEAEKRLVFVNRQAKAQATDNDTIRK